MRIETDYPGGNIVLDRIEGDTLFVRPDLTGIDGSWFYFNFRIHDVAGRHVRVEFTDKNNGGGPLTIMGPCLRFDDQPWHWSGPQDHYDRFELQVPADVHVVQCALSIPYTLADLQSWLASHERIQTSVLGTSAQGRPMHHLHLPARRPEHQFILTARTHACESIANYVLEGVMAAFLDQQGELAAFRQQSIDLHVLPMLDVDGVETGHQGKNRQPHDHNRDWIDQPLYPETRVAQSWLASILTPASWVLDVHCPWVRGERNDALYFCGKPGALQAGVNQLSEQLRGAAPDALPFDPADNIAHGEGWNLGPVGTGSRWVTDHFDVRMATTLEVAYAKARGVPVTIDRSRATGRELANAITQLCMR